METILRILKRAGGWNPGLYLKIENLPYPTLVIEAQDDVGPLGMPALLVAQFKDALCFAEMQFEIGLGEREHLDPFHYRNDRTGEDDSTRFVEENRYVCAIRLYEQHKKYARQWDETLRLQGFFEAFERQQQTKGT